MKHEVWIFIVNWSYLFLNQNCRRLKRLDDVSISCLRTCFSFHAKKAEMNGHLGKRMDLFSIAWPHPKSSLFNLMVIPAQRGGRHQLYKTSQGQRFELGHCRCCAIFRWRKKKGGKGGIKE